RLRATLTGMTRSMMFSAEAGEKASARQTLRYTQIDGRGEGTSRFPAEFERFRLPPLPGSHHSWLTETEQFERNFWTGNSLDSVRTAKTRTGCP
ncbi:MAG: hypothetical protein ACKOJF_30320, partial [Planctomycetaceae bacterium]